MTRRVDEEDDGQDPGGENDEQDATSTMSMRTFVTTLAQLSVCHKPREVVPYDATSIMTRYDEYDVDEEGGQDPGGKYDGE